MARCSGDGSEWSLRRWTDRVRLVVGWVLLVGVVPLVVGAGVAASSAYRAGLDRIAQDAAARTTVVGVLLDDAAPAGAAPVRPSRVSYVDARGRAHVGEVPVTGRLAAGTAVRFEVDGDGRLGVEPPSRGDALFSAVSAALAVVLLGGLGLAAVWCGVLCALAARNHAAWQREWQLVEPRWSGRDPAAP
jgi:hypothetical protein